VAKKARKKSAQGRARLREAESCARRRGWQDAKKKSPTSNKLAVKKAAKKAPAKKAVAKKAVARRLRRRRQLPRRQCEKEKGPAKKANK